MLGYLPLSAEPLSSISSNLISINFNTSCTWIDYKRVYKLGYYTTLLSATFTGTNGTTVASYVPEVGPSGANAGGATYTIQSNALLNSAVPLVDNTGGYYHAIWSLGSSDITISGTGNVGLFAYRFGLCFRYSDANNFWFAGFTSSGSNLGNVFLYKVIAGIAIPITAISGSTPANGQIKVVTYGNLITVYNGDQTITYGSTIDEFNNTATIHGITNYLFRDADGIQTLNNRNMDNLIVISGDTGGISTWNDVYNLRIPKTCTWNDTVSMTRGGTSCTWYDKIALGKNTSLTWNDTYSLNKNTVETWNDRFIIHNGKTCTWNNKYSINHPTICTWNETIGLNNKLICTWNDLLRINKTNLSTWNEKFIVSHGSLSTWNDNANAIIVTTSATCTWNSQIRVNKNYLETWNNFNQINKQVNDTWNDKYVLSSSNNYTWNDLIVIRGINSQISWNDYARINQLIHSMWITIGELRKNYEIKWGITSVVEQSLSSNWNDLISIVKKYPSLWNSLYTINKLDGMTWNDIFQINKTISSTWRTIIGVLNTLILLEGILIMRSEISEELIGRFDVEEELLMTTEKMDEL